jgi:hypothetical protein
MRFIIADTFMKSLGRLSREDQNQIKRLGGSSPTKASPLLSDAALVRA